MTANGRPSSPHRSSIDQSGFLARSFTSGNDGFFVGSPEQSDQLCQPHFQSIDSSAHDDTLGAPSSRIGRRISIQSSSNRRSSPFSQRRSRPREWSLFAERMANEGQLPPLGSRRTSQALRQSQYAPSIEAPILEQPTPPKTPYESDEEEDYDSDSSYTSLSSSPSSSPGSMPTSRLDSLRQRIPEIPVLYRNIFKCALAYFIASLFTFSPILSRFISEITSSGDGIPLSSGHMVATIAVYFNPAKTLGSMMEADFYCLAALVYSSVVSLLSMSLFWWLERQEGLEWVGDFAAIFVVGICMSVVAWMKVWMASPSFNTACSMTAIIIFVVIVKEGGVETLLQVIAIVITGALTTNLVCLTIWPQSATDNLQVSMTKTLDSFATLLTMLTETFLLEQGEHSSCHQKLQRAVETHQSTFTALKKSISEAKSEWVLRGGEAWAESYEDAVASMTRLAQHLNGLRSGTRLQTELSRAGIRTFDGKQASRKGKDAMGHTESAPLTDDTFDEEAAILKAASDMFGDLVEELGPPLKSLTTTCTTSLKRLRQSWVRSRDRTHKTSTMNAEEFAELSDRIEMALRRFDSTSNHAVLRAYRRSDVSDLDSSITSYLADSQHPVMAHGDNEHVFLVYFFIFTLQEFVRELVSLNDAMSRVYHVEQQWAHRPPIWTRLFRQMSRFVRLSWAGKKAQDEPQPIERPRVRRSISNYLLPEKLLRNRKTKPYFPKIQPHAPNTILTPAAADLAFVGRVKQRLWALGNRLIENDTKYAVKAGMATGILAAPSFFEQTRPIFNDYWGQWALISFFVVISPTIGATNLLSVYRVLGTLFGATIAAGMYSLFPENAIVLSVFGFFFSIPCFYYICAKPQYATASRFVLLTYNLTCLYCYNLRQADVPVLNIASHRAIAVIVGVLWAAIVSRFWWPAEARRELTKALGDFCLNMGWLYTKLVSSNTYSTEPEQSSRLMSHSERTPLLSPEQRLDNSIKDFMAMELHLQIKLIELQGLLSQTVHEPRLKGPFPVKLYRNVLTRLQTILDKLHSMRCVTVREEWYTSVRKDFIIPVNKERKEMAGNIILSFSVLSSAFRLKAPLPPYLPPAEKARQRLVNAIRGLDVVRNRDVKGSRQLLFFAYALTMRGVTQELEELGRLCQQAFGVIGHTPEEFDALFVMPQDANRLIENAV